MATLADVKFSPLSNLASLNILLPRPCYIVKFLTRRNREPRTFARFDGLLGETGPKYFLSLLKSDILEAANC